VYAVVIHEADEIFIPDHLSTRAIGALWSEWNHPKSELIYVENDERHVFLYLDGQ
jgi:hypothetical protein